MQQSLLGFGLFPGLKHSVLACVWWAGNDQRDSNDCFSARYILTAAICCVPEAHGIGRGVARHLCTKKGFCKMWSSTSSASPISCQGPPCRATSLPMWPARLCSAFGVVLSMFLHPKSTNKDSVSVCSIKHFVRLHNASASEVNVCEARYRMASPREKYAQFVTKMTAFQTLRNHLLRIPDN